LPQNQPDAAPPLMIYDVSAILTQGQQGTGAPVIEGRVIDTANIHTAEILSVVVSPNGTQFATAAANNDNSVVLWDFATGAPITQFTEHTDSLLTLAFNDDGSQLVSGSRDRTLRIWDLQRAEIVRDFVGHSTTGARGVVAVYGPGDRTILSGGADGSVRLWDTESGRAMQELDGHERPVNTVDLSDDAAYAISGGDDQQVLVWDVVSGEALFTLDTDAGVINWVRFLPNSTQFVVGGSEGGLAIWDAVTGQRVREFTAPVCQQPDESTLPVNAVDALALSTDGTVLVTGGADECVSIWNVADGSLAERFQLLGTAVRSVAISPDKARVAIGGASGLVSLRQISDQTVIRNFTGHDRAVVGLAFSPDNTSLLSAAADETVRLWDIASGFEVRRYTLESEGPVNFQSLEFSSFADTILTGLTNSTIRLWRMRTSVDGVLEWAFQNRYVPALTCAQRVQFRLEVCDAEGNPPAREPFPVPPVTERPASLLVLSGGTEAVINSSEGDTVRLRNSTDNSDPNTVITQLADGTPVTVLAGPFQGSGLQWWQVRTDGDYEGYVAELLPEENLQLIVPVSAFNNLTTARYAS
jgi:WD40 repeat protein